MSADQIDQGLTELPQVSNDHDQAVGGCCRLGRNGLLMGAMAFATFGSILAAAYFAGQASSARTASQVNFPPIDATGAVTSEGYSMSTGLISDSSEALFVLDHNSGLLQCSVLYPRAGAQNRILGLFTASVTETLGASAKGGSYMIVTGRTDFPSTNNAPAAPNVVYVLDTSSGNWVCYGIPFQRTNFNSNRPQQGALIALARGTANPVVERDQR